MTFLDNVSTYIPTICLMIALHGQANAQSSTGANHANITDLAPPSDTITQTDGMVNDRPNPDPDPYGQSGILLNELFQIQRDTLVDHVLNGYIRYRDSDLFDNIWDYLAENKWAVMVDTTKAALNDDSFAYIFRSDNTPRVIYFDGDDQIPADFWAAANGEEFFHAFQRELLSSLYRKDITQWLDQNDINGRRTILMPTSYRAWTHFIEGMAKSYSVTLAYQYFDQQSDRGGWMDYQSTNTDLLPVSDAVANGVKSGQGIAAVWMHGLKAYMQSKEATFYDTDYLDSQSANYEQRSILNSEPGQVVGIELTPDHFKQLIGIFFDAMNIDYDSLSPDLFEQATHSLFNPIELDEERFPAMYPNESSIDTAFASLQDDLKWNYTFHLQGEFTLGAHVDEILDPDWDVCKLPHKIILHQDVRNTISCAELSGSEINTPD